MLILDMEMPKDCGHCLMLDESGDYPMCRITGETRGYNFDIFHKKMDRCPIKNELVLCKDCRWYDKEDWCDKLRISGIKEFEEVWYCAEGERLEV